MPRSIRLRLLLLFLICIALLSAINGAIGAWGLLRIRDQAIDDSASALEQQASQYLQNLAQERANATVEMLRVDQQVAAAVRDYLDKTPTRAEPAPGLTLQKLPNGRRYHHGVTTILLPAGGDAQEMANKLAGSQSLEVLLPGLVRQLPGVARVSYMTPFDAIRTYPWLNPHDVPANWTIAQDPAYQVGLKNAIGTVVWSEIHPALNNAGQVVSAVAPVTHNGEIVGQIAVDVSLGYLTSYLKHIEIEKTGFAFLIDDDGHLVAAPEEGQRQLMGHTIGVQEQGRVTPDLGQPEIKELIVQMRRGGSAIVRTAMGGRGYIVAYAPIASLGWSLGLAAPLDEITASTSATSARISGIAAQIGTLAGPAAMLALLLLGLAISLILSRQVIRPLTVLVSATRAIAAGEIRPIELAGKDEIGQLARAFNGMIEALAASRAEITVANEQLEHKVQERTADLDQAVARLEESLATQQQLLQTLRDVSTPVIPVVKGVLAMPLVGQIDEERAQNMTGALLARIERERAHTVLLDITGVPVIDTHVAQSLLCLVDASRLLGAEVVLVGVSPEVAQTIVTLGIDLRGLRTAADLRSAVEGLLASRYKASRSTIPI